MGSSRFFAQRCWLAGYGSLFPVVVGPEGDVLAGGKIRSLQAGVFSSDSRLVAQRPSRAPAKNRLGVQQYWKLLPERWSARYPCGGRRTSPSTRTAGRSPEQRRTVSCSGTCRPGRSTRRKAHTPHLDDPLPFARVLRYFPDGTKLVTGHIDTTALVWEVPSRPKTAKPLNEKGAPRPGPTSRPRTVRRDGPRSGRWPMTPVWSSSFAER